MTTRLLITTKRILIKETGNNQMEVILLKLLYHDFTSFQSYSFPSTIFYYYKIFLATHCKNTGNLKDAEKYASRLLDYSGKEKEEAKALLREIQSSGNNATA